MRVSERAPNQKVVYCGLVSAVVAKSIIFANNLITMFA